MKLRENSYAWDIEHVNSATDNPLDDFEDQKEWLKNAQLDILNISKDLNNQIENFLTDSKSKNKTSSPLLLLYLLLFQFQHDSLLLIDKVLLILLLLTYLFLFFFYLFHLIE